MTKNHKITKIIKMLLLLLHVESLAMFRWVIKTQ